MEIELGTTNPQEAQSIIALETTNSHEMVHIKIVHISFEFK